MQMGAVVDHTGAYRYALWRQWGDGDRPRLGIVMLNPSRADAFVNDPTIRRCITLAQSWGYAGLEVVNLFAYRTAHPRDLRRVADPVGAHNDRYLTSLSHRCDRILLAWGNGGTFQGRDRQVRSLFPPELLDCLGLTRAGQPRHPLYLPGYAKPIPMVDFNPG